MKTLKIKIVTPEKVIYEGEVMSVSLPTVEGEITILPGHIPVISAITAGELSVRYDNKMSEEFFSITRGVAEIDSKNVTILTDAAERAEEIDAERAEEAKKKAKDLMTKVQIDGEGYAEALAKMERAVSRIRIARKRRHGSSVKSPKFDQ